MPAYKLMYFNVRGRGEVPRLMFAEAGVKYEDCRFEGADWPKHKPNTPFGQVPVLMVDDKPLPQSHAIIRYLAREFNLNGETSLQEAYADMFIETLNDSLSKLPYMEKDEAKKAELTKACFENNVIPTFNKFEEKFAKKKSESQEKEVFLIGKRLTYADLALMNALTTLDAFRSGFFDKYPNLKELAERISKRPKIAAWINSRPKTSM